MLRCDGQGRRRLTRVALAAIVALLAALGGAGAAAAAALPAGATRLSDERLTTQWAHASGQGSVFAAPALGARRVARLRLLTEDGFPDVYVALAQWRDGAGRTWIRIRVPGRPNGRTGWVLRQALGPLQTVHRVLVVDRSALRATLYDRGRRIFSARVGVGKPSTPTPGGRFWIREKFHVVGAPLYGPRAIGTSAYAPTLSDWPGGGVVGLHGTDEPGLIPGRPSHGCIRLRNADILRLYALVSVGTPVRIL
jgi:L,D-transpeptidase-like protein